MNNASRLWLQRAKSALQLGKTTKDLSRGAKVKRFGAGENIRQKRSRCSIGKMAKILTISSSGYYAWKCRKPSCTVGGREFMASTGTGIDGYLYRVPSPPAHPQWGISGKT